MNEIDIYLGLGSNLGDRHTALLSAIELLVHKVGRLVRCSSFFETEPYGFESEHQFMNAVALFRTTLSPRELLVVTQDIERELGRTNKSLHGYEDRVIDIDILLYGDERVDEPDLQIPHPRMQERPFVMEPMEELRANMNRPAQR